MDARKYAKAAAELGIHVLDTWPWWNILIRLPAKSVLRFRAVCKAFRDHISSPEFLREFQRLQKPQPLILPADYARDDPRYVHLEAIDLLTDQVRHIFRFATAAAGEQYVHRAPGTIVFAVHGSVDGLLLVSFLDSWYVCNPSLRQWAPMPALDPHEVVGFYSHAASGEYRVLYQKGADDPSVDTCYYIITVGSQQAARSIGCPVSPATMLEAWFDRRQVGLEGAFREPPALVGGNLYWPQRDRIMVFDTAAEVFSWIDSPDTNSVMKLMEMESNSRLGALKVGLWILEDHEGEIWAHACRIELSLAQITMGSAGSDRCTPFVVSPEGDVLIECPSTPLNLGDDELEVWPACLLHYSKKDEERGKFNFEHNWTTSPTHLLKESLLPHAFLQPQVDGDALTPPFFQGL
ncbi:hypothetical protein BRADI_1g64841v3 [Brachypodium distachyon]|uniref:Uncharacterized protein n=2 Tax=Brachypodium distachyon TaxID=15368 RepID=A0A0Q3SAU2_BRADI|nr:hypothetical protein BRADI_1g64841v3 [Brachypodium distachyon]